MNRFFLLLPLLALVAAPVLADDPATNAAGSNLESVEPHLGVEVFSLSHVLASDMVVELKRALPEKGVSLGKGAIQVDERSNALLVMAPASSMGAIRDAVVALDVSPTLVRCRIEALEMPAESVPAAMAQNGTVPSDTADGLRRQEGAKFFFCPTVTTRDGNKATLATSDEIKNEEGETIQSDSFTVCVTPVVLDGGKISLTVSAEHMIDGAPAQNLEESMIETGPGEAAVFPMPGREGKRILLFAAPSVFDLAALDEPTLPAGGTWEPASPASRLNPATNAPAATPAGKAERIRHAIEQLEYEVRGLDEELAKTDTARTAEETTAIKTRRDAIAQRIEQERRFLAGEGPDPSTPSPAASETHAENAENAEN